MTITGLDKISGLFRRLRVDNAAKSRRFAGHAHHAAMICNHSDLNTANTSVARDHLLSIVGLELVEMTIVQQTFEQLSDVVRLSMIFGNDVVEFFGRSQGLGCWCDRRQRR